MCRYKLWMIVFDGTLWRVGTGQHSSVGGTSMSDVAEHRATAELQGSQGASLLSFSEVLWNRLAYV